MCNNLRDIIKNSFLFPTFKIEFIFPCYFPCYFSHIFSVFVETDFTLVMAMKRKSESLIRMISLLSGTILTLWSWFVQKVGFYSSSHQSCSIKKGVLRNFAKFTKKHLRQSLFFNKVAGLKKRDSDSVFSCEYCELSKNTIFTEHLWMAASCFATTTHKIFETNSSFHGNSALREKFNFCFSKFFAIIDKKTGH